MLVGNLKSLCLIKLLIASRFVYITCWIGGILVFDSVESEYVLALYMIILVPVGDTTLRT